MDRSGRYQSRHCGEHHRSGTRHPRSRGHQYSGLSIHTLHRRDPRPGTGCGHHFSQPLQFLPAGHRTRGDVHADIRQLDTPVDRVWEFHRHQHQQLPLPRPHRQRVGRLRLRGHHGRRHHRLCGNGFLHFLRVGHLHLHRRQLHPHRTTGSFGDGQLQRCDHRCRVHLRFEHQLRLR